MGSCVSLFFVDVDMMQNFNGMAQVGGPSSGLCSNKNSAIVSMAHIHQPQDDLPFLRSVVTVTHEIAHLLSAKDTKDLNENLCKGSTFDKNGKFIMFENSLRGDGPNNYDFDECNIRRMENLIKSNGHCIKEITIPLTSVQCGNGVIDSDDEECDCGPPLWERDDNHLDSVEIKCCNCVLCRKVRHYVDCIYGDLFLYLQYAALCVSGLLLFILLITLSVVVKERLLTSDGETLLEQEQVDEEDSLSNSETISAERERRLQSSSSQESLPSISFELTPHRLTAVDGDEMRESPD